MINNVKIVSSLLEFPDEDTFYFLQILKRKKEHKDLGSNSLCIKTYYIKSVDYLETKMPDIISLCDFHDARAYINLNRRSFEKTAFQLLRKITDQIMNKDFKACKKAYESVCGIHADEKNKKWIIDIDRKDGGSHGEWMRGKLKEIMPNEGEDKVLAVIPTKNGYHLITKPFNVQEAKVTHAFLTEDIHKDNPTVLYIK